MRIKKGMSWDAIAAKMGEGRSPDSERKAYSKALEIVLK